MLAKHQRSPSTDHLSHVGKFADELLVCQRSPMLYNPPVQYRTRITYTTDGVQGVCAEFDIEAIGPVGGIDLLNDFLEIQAQCHEIGSLSFGVG